MAGIQADTHTIVAYTVYYVPKLLKFTTDLTAFACHSFQKHGNGIAGRKGGLQGVHDLGNAGLSALPYMTAGMKIIEITGQRRHSAQIVRKNRCGKGAGRGLCGAKIHSICAVGNQGREAKLRHFCHSRGSIGRILCSCLRAAGIAGEKRKGICADGMGRIDRIQIAF